MEDQEYLDEDFASNGDIETEEEGNEEEETTPNKNKNKSNFNNLYRKTKELENSLSAKDEELANALAELEEWRNLNPEIEENKKSNKEVDDLKLTVFTIKNPESEPYKKEILNTMREYWITDFNKAWKLVKVDLPEESKTKTDFSIWKTSISTKDLSKVSAEEALNLPLDKQREWRKIHLG